MSETEDKTNILKQKYSKLSIIIFILGLLSMYIILMREPLYHSSKYFERILILKTISIIALIAGLSILLTKRKRFKGRGFAITGTLAAALSLILGLSELVPRPEPVSPGMLCGTNLAGLGKAMLVYANDYNDKYPAADKWCDLLIIHSEVEPSVLVCKGSDAKINESSYAININIAGKNHSDFSHDTILLFETNSGKNSLVRDYISKNRQWYQVLSERTGKKNPSRILKVKGSDEIYKDCWNQTGGPEILTTENHNGEGCYILFNDGHVEFVEKDSIEDLKWNEEKNNE